VPPCDDPLCPVCLPSENPLPVDSPIDYSNVPPSFPDPLADFEMVDGVLLDEKAQSKFCECIFPESCVCGKPVYMPKCLHIGPCECDARWSDYFEQWFQEYKPDISSSVTGARW